MTNYLGIDYGAKRIGLAVGDDEVKLARPLRTLDNDRWHEDLRSVIKGENIDEVVVGLPRTLDGNDSGQTMDVREFAMGLSILGLPLHLQDEAGTSSLARERLGKKITDKGQIDAEAAAIILQDYLDSL